MLVWAWARVGVEVGVGVDVVDVVAGVDVGMVVDNSVGLKLSSALASLQMLSLRVSACTLVRRR